MSDRELKPCGTYGAYQRHKQRGEPIDDACRAAKNAYQNARTARARAAEAMERQIARVRELHRSAAERCAYDGEDWPCATARALDPPGGLRCATCHRPIPPGQPYKEAPLGMTGPTPVVELVCGNCKG